MTTLSETAFESAMDAFAAAVETSTERDAALESEVVCNVEVITESETPFESATLAASPADTALESAEKGLKAVAVDWAIEISVDCEASLDVAAEISEDSVSAALTPFESAVEIKRDWLAPLLSLEVCSVEITTESDTALLSATLALFVAVAAAPPAETPLLSAVDVRSESDNAFESATLADDPALNPLLSAVEISNDWLKDLLPVDERDDESAVEPEIALLSAVDALVFAVPARPPALKACDSAVDPISAALSALLSDKASLKYESTVHAVAPFPSFRLLVSVSMPTSPDASTGFAAVQLAAVSRLN